MDKLDKKIPIYKVIEPIDKVVPSFALFLVILLLLVGFLVLPFIFPPAQSSFSVKVYDEEGDPFAGVVVNLEYDSTTVSLTTNNEGAIEPVSMAVGTTISLSIDETGYETESKTYTAKEGEDVKSKKRF